MALSSSKKRNFSKFSLREAFLALDLTDLIPWSLDAEPVEPTAFFQERLQRLEQTFDLQSYEESKKLLIDAICEEALLPCHHLKLWKGASLQGEIAGGYVDYLGAERKRYLEAPFLCVIEARKDDFEQGLAQCLIELKVCQEVNQRLDRSIEVCGIVSNGQVWQFYRLAAWDPEQPGHRVYETPPYSTGNLEFLLGQLRSLFQQCEQSLLATKSPSL
ncbi:MAG: hypothetical protein VKK80_04130 [Prochlorothrix sp.]|nr:hypothetical protein [Prochlorothrix sp.]